MPNVMNLWYTLRELGKEMTAKGPRVWCHLFVDECHQYGNKLDELWRQSRRFGITLIGISQRPASTSHTILTQSPDHVLFKCGAYELPYFQKYDIPIEEHRGWLAKDWHYILYDQMTGKVTRYEPVRM